MLDKSPFDIIVKDFNAGGNLNVAVCTEYNSEGMGVLPVTTVILLNKNKGCLNISYGSL